MGSNGNGNIAELSAMFPDRPDLVQEALHAGEYMKNVRSDMKMKGQMVAARAINEAAAKITASVYEYAIKEAVKNEGQGKTIKYPDLWFTTVMFRYIERGCHEEGKKKPTQPGPASCRTTVTAEENEARLKKDLEWLEQFSATLENI